MEPGMKYKGGNLSMRGAELAKITQIRSCHDLCSKENHEHRGGPPPPPCPPLSPSLPTGLGTYFHEQILSSHTDLVIKAKFVLVSSTLQAEA
jgi:hypothetical protein